MRDATDDKGTVAEPIWSLVKAMATLTGQRDMMSGIRSMGEDVIYMEFALQEAKDALIDDNLFPAGAVVSLNGQIIGRGRKTCAVHPGHAEILAMKQAFEGRSYTHADGIVLYSTIEPCVMCFGTILYSPIQRVVYAMEDPWAGVAHLPKSMFPIGNHENFPIVTGGALREDALRLVKEYAQRSGKAFWQNQDNPLVKLVMRDARDGN